MYMLEGFVQMEHQSGPAGSEYECHVTNSDYDVRLMSSVNALSNRVLGMCTSCRVYTPEGNLPGALIFFPVFFSGTYRLKVKVHLGVLSAPHLRTVGLSLNSGSPV
ncbi:unnamed protein product [Boreogadus saida]